MIVYIGFRDHKGTCTVLRWQEPCLEPLNPRLDLWNHSPCGFEWGYGGSGPAQLSLALLADATRSDATAKALHQELKAQHIAKMPQHYWVMPAERLLAWVAEMMDEPDEESIVFWLPLEGDRNGK